jgi:hypothetical protein
MFKNKSQELLATIGMALSAVLLLALFALLMVNTFPVNASASYEAEAQVVDPVVFDTSVLETWCHDESMGTVRMVGGVVHERTGDVWTLHDEQGNAWTVEDLHNMQEHGWMLLWIADNHTADDVTDDVIVKLWVEVY